MLAVYRLRFFQDKNVYFLGKIVEKSWLCDVRTQFAGGAQLSVPYAVPMMSALRIDWFRFFFCYSYGSIFNFRFTKCFCFPAEHNKDEVLAHFATFSFHL